MKKKLQVFHVLHGESVAIQNRWGCIATVPILGQPLEGMIPDPGYLEADYHFHPAQS